MDVRISPSLPHSDFFVSEDIRLQLVIDNDGAETVAIPDPESRRNRLPGYRLLSENGTQTVSFNRAGINPADAGEPADDFDMIALAPGRASVSFVPIDRILRDIGPGSYRLEFDMRAIAGDSTVDPLSFTVRAVESSEGSLAPSRVPEDPFEIRSTWIFHSDAEHLLYQRTFSESIEFEGIIENAQNLRLCRVGASATAPLGSYSDPGEPAAPFWSIWTEGDRLYAAHSPLEAPLVATLPSPPAFVLASPLLVGSLLDVFVVGRDRRLHLVRFRTADEPEPGDVLDDPDAVDEAVESEAGEIAPNVAEPELLASFDLPCTPAGAVVRSVPDRSAVIVILTAERNGQVELFHLEIRDGIPRTPGRTMIRNARLVPAASPLLSIDEKGNSRVSLLCSIPEPGESDSSRQTIAIATATFDPAGRIRITGEHGLALLGTAEAPVRAGALSIHETDGAMPRLDAVVLLEGGALAGSILGKPFGMLSQIVGPTVPLQIISHRDRLLIATSQPPIGPMLGSISPLPVHQSEQEP